MCGNMFIPTHPLYPPPWEDKGKTVGAKKADELRERVEEGTGTEQPTDPLGQNDKSCNTGIKG